MKTSADIYRFNIDPESDTAPANVLRFVGRNRKVLELGAGPGSIARPMAEVNGCEVSAVELDVNCIATLEGFCKRVWQRDLNDPSWIADIPHASYDAVVIADVLEHIVDPWTTLRNVTGLLNESGSIVVSVPHASHASIMACLLTHDFKYGDWGLLDRTHIRFFSMKNIQALFDGAGLAIVEVAHVLRHPTETEFADAWAALPARTRAVLESSEYANVYQVVIRAVPAGRTGTLPIRPLLDIPSPPLSKLRYIAFYLPQFHPIPENDRWWGSGFTEWTNVTKAAPLFPGHYQPHLPADLGFYDLRVRETQHQQIELARLYGIDAFCFYYYWFGGARLLERPLLDFLADPKADIDFCLCWANENWTRKWDASEQEILMAQTYSPESDLAFIESMLPFFRDRRYLKMNGAPVLIVYRPQQMPDAKATAVKWRQYCRDAGIGEIHIIAALTHLNEDFEQFGYDAGLEFPPHNASTVTRGWLRNLGPEMGGTIPIEGAVWDYGEFAQCYLGQDYTQRRVYRGVVPSWDNTARMNTRAFLLNDATPANYERWLEAASHLTVMERLPAERLVFINAWNEWAEGCHLEPDRVNGRAFLEATQRVKFGRSTISMEREKATVPPAYHVGTKVDAPPPPAPPPPAPPPPAPPTPVPAPPVTADGVAELAVRALSGYPRLYRAMRFLYRATLKKPEAAL